MEIIVFILIMYFASCVKQVPNGQEAIVRRNNEIYKTYRAGETFFINPFTDVVEYSNKNRTSNRPNVNYINPMNGSRNVQSQHQKGYKTFSINTSIPFRSIDGKSLYVKVYAMFRTSTSTTIATTSIDRAIKKAIVDYYSNENSTDISDNATKHELLLFDLLRDTFSNDSIRLEKFEATPSNARITTHNTHAKAPCSHYDDPKPQYRPNDSKYAYSAGNAIKNSLLDTIAEQSQNPISGDTYSDNPIKETFNITTIFNGSHMIDVNNMDSNVDPIDNKI